MVPSGLGLSSEKVGMRVLPWLCTMYCHTEGAARPVRTLSYTQSARPALGLTGLRLTCGRGCGARGVTERDGGQAGGGVKWETGEERRVGCWQRRELRHSLCCVSRGDDV